MIQNTLFKLLLLPFSLLYGFGVSLRDFFYRKGILKGIEFDIPSISVGNLSLGGAGKTPHIEYLIRLLKDYIHIATLSRGYKRKTKGFLFVEQGNNADMVGDEPLQFKRKFPDIIVSVAESRTFAIPKIMMKKPEMQTVLLDDAFQHRSIQPGLNILLTEYDRPFTRDWLLPSGRLREWRSSYQRADIIIVSKCPPQLAEADRAALIKEINPLSHQQIYFSYYTYQPAYHILQPKLQIQLGQNLDILLICAIARTDYLLKYLEESVSNVTVLEYEDHHYFSKHDIAHLKTTFNNLPSDNKIILTTEKDAMRLEMHRPFLLEHQLPIFALPIEVAFHHDDGPAFDSAIKQFLLSFKA